MGKEHFHTYSICSLDDASGSREIIVDRLSDYIEEHRHLVFPHKHDFYHVVFFTAGGGVHSIDFNNYKVRPGQLYVMAPGQVHTWDFNDAVNGFIINFSNSFLSGIVADPQYASRFSFFAGPWQQQVFDVDAEQQPALVSACENLLEESALTAPFSDDRLRILLIDLLIRIQRYAQQDSKTTATGYNSVVLKNFRDLVEQQFREYKLTKEYAAQLYITPNHLNALCKDITGNTAGELIRQRVILEAKRMLTNAGLDVAIIAAELGFNDASYFTRFFRKATGVTPAAFRKAYYSKI